MAVLSGPCFPSHFRDELTECLRVPKYVKVRIGRVFHDRLHKYRTALPAILHNPPPEVSTLARSSYGSASTAGEREVQKNDRVRRTQPDSTTSYGPRSPSIV